MALLSLQGVEALVLERLRGEITELPVEPYPDKPAKYVEEELDSAKGVILVNIFDGERVSGHEGGGEFVLTPMLTVFASDLRGPRSSSYSIIERVVELFDGVKLNLDGEPLDSEAVSFYIAGEVKGLWQWTIMLRLTPRLARRRSR